MPLLEQHGRALLQRPAAVGIELGRMYTDAARTKAARRALDERQAVFDAPEMLERARGPAEVERAIQIGGNRVHVDCAKAQPLLRLGLRAQLGYPDALQRCRV